MTGAGVAEYLAGQRLYRDVVYYSHLGEHRTGTSVDRRTREWIAERLALAGLSTEPSPWSVRQFAVEQAELRVAGESVECFPLWFPRATGPQPIDAPLSLLQGGAVAAGRIACAVADTASEGNSPQPCKELVGAAAASGAVAILIGTEGPSEEIYAFNQEHLEPQPIPAALVAPRDWPLIAAAAADGASVSLVIAGRDDPATETANVVGRYDGGRETIVVSTPTTGWFQCAGERGPGIALFLALASWVAERRPPVRYIFTANAGHELGNLGMQHFLASGTVAPDSVVGWLHLGASIGTIGWGGGDGRTQARTLGASPGLLPLVAQSFADLPHLGTIERPLGGEVPYVVDAGYRPIVGIAGRFPAFHTRADHPETATRPEMLEPIAVALTRLLLGMERRPVTSNE
jgi:hypothetical protein